MIPLNSFWTSRLAGAGAERLMRCLDWNHQHLYLPLVAKWGLDLLRTDRIVEFGCGPCGLAPWFARAEKTGVEPWAKEFTRHGIDYLRLGYSEVYPETAQEFARRRLRFDLAISCNAIDHDPDPEGMLQAIAAAANVLFVCFDRRHKATAMHPGITAGGLKLPAPWELRRVEVLAMKEFKQLSQEIDGRLCQLWVRP